LDPKRKRSIDVILVEMGLAPDVEHARTFVNCGLVLFKNQTLNAKSRIADDEINEIRIKHQKRFVSRGAVKLQTVFDNYPMDIQGKVCFDIGASTGGFTQLLLEKGAAAVYAVDVGVGILDHKLRTDPKVIVIEGVNVRNINEYKDAAQALSSHPADACVIDVSFISLSLVIPAILPFIKSGGILVPLVKPQFEAEKGEVGSGGIVEDEAVRLKALKKVEKVLIDNGCEILKMMQSGITGAQGNIEYFYVGIKK
jgi:23S rRNA (cytidine1920-2'-O)/16S rRNA (cytidine1409-2'-O)-methyltransferase